MKKFNQYTILGIVFLILTISFFTIMFNDIGIINLLLPILAIMLLAFTITYIKRKISKKERARINRTKSVYYGFYFLIAYIIIAGGVAYLGNNNVDFQLIFTTVCSITVITLSMILLIVERRY